MNSKEIGRNRLEGLLHELYRTSGSEPGKSAAAEGGDRRHYRRSFRPKFWTAKPRAKVLTER